MNSSANGIRNNCEIIRRLARGDLDENEMADIGESLATGKTLEQIRMFANIFGGDFSTGFTQQN